MSFVVTTTLSSQLSSAVAGAGAEAGYVATQNERTAKETLNDQFLTSAVKTKLIATADVPALDINVDTFKGEVTLRGALKNQTAIDKAIEAAWAVNGVKNVQSKLVLVH